MAAFRMFEVLDQQLNTVMNEQFKTLVVKRIEVIRIDETTRGIWNRYRPMNEKPLILSLNDELSKYKLQPGEIFTAIYVPLPKYGGMASLSYVPHLHLFVPIGDVFSFAKDAEKVDRDIPIYVYLIYFGYVRKGDKPPGKKHLKKGRLELYDDKGAPLYNSEFYPLKVLRRADFIVKHRDVGWRGPYNSDILERIASPTHSEAGYMERMDEPTPARRECYAFMLPPPLFVDNFHTGLWGYSYGSVSGGYPSGANLLAGGLEFGRDPRDKNMYAWGYRATIGAFGLATTMSGRAVDAYNRGASPISVATIDITGLFEYYGIPSPIYEER